MKGKRKGKQNIDIVTVEETKILLHEVKEQSRILKGQQATIGELKKHNEILEKITVTGIAKVNADIKQEEIKDQLVNFHERKIARGMI